MNYFIIAGKETGAVNILLKKRVCKICMKELMDDEEASQHTLRHAVRKIIKKGNDGPIKDKKKV